MFKLEGKMTFINIDQNYLKKLHDACSEVYYKAKCYDNKPYIGILIDKNDRQYVIPLTSAKVKHKTWKNVNKECYLIYETSKITDMRNNDIWIAMEGDSVKHILSVMDVKKMIPIVPGVYSRVDINIEDGDDNATQNYKNLLNKEYSFCLKIINEVIGKANKLYEKQMKNGKVIKFCCDFKALEKVADKVEQSGLENYEKS